MTPKLTLTTDPCVLASPPATATDGGRDGVGSPRAMAPRGQVPLVAATLFCIAGTLLGVVIDHRFLQVPVPTPKIALAEEGAVVLEALLSQPNLDATDARRLVGESIASVVRRYQSEGYLVVNASRGSDGQLVVEAVPPSTLDITDEMRASVARSVSMSTTARSPTAPSAPAKALAGRAQAN